MAADNHKGDSSDNSQGTALMKRQRDPEQTEADDRRQKSQAEGNLKATGGKKFVSKEETVENKLKLSTIGLVKLEEFQRIKGELEEERQREAAKTLIHQTPGEASGDKPKAKRKKKPTLTFDEDEDDVVVDRRARKNPGVDTSFLPDKEREERDARKREELRQTWLLEQEAIKQEAITITYSYWDGSGHRKQVRCRKGDTIAQFLDKCKAQVPELRMANVDGLVYVKEDLIIPHHYSFYDFILNKARGKSGPLFSFDVHDDVRLTHDARIEKDDSHAGKVCERSWYERNKHIFPANRWEVFDPEKNYGSYTIRDSKRSK
ncbi:hypothetical protein GGH91_004988 [Coemansia sp. RSA 2671]|nr:hypothetical protein LPJ60_005037 [Coemansia sp. RSA 2675]KAJ2337909.1 hypothetical protein GGH91_004988 [Coemansia sp. RSA 2671]KAJ2413264.1 hypothetical protein GGI10_003171 [Coemansia sp. RSA 2530]